MTAEPAVPGCIEINRLRQRATAGVVGPPSVWGISRDARVRAGYYNLEGTTQCVLA